MRSYLGIDGGGTKTALAVVDETGRVLAEHRAPTCYYLEAGSTEGTGLVARVLGEAIPTVCADAGLTPAGLDYAFVTLPGYGEASGDVAALDAIPAGILGHDRYAVDNDMVCGWAGSLGLADGINVVAGTGSIAYGQRGEATARVGGWGELIGDEGSGYWIAVRALAQATRMSDGRRTAGPLLELLEDELGLPSPWDLVELVHHRWGGDRARIAALTPLVVRAAEAGDRAAAEVLADAAVELITLVRTARHRLDFAEGEVVPVSYSGGVFQADLVRDAFRRGLEAGSGEEGYTITEPRFSPVIGAALAAAARAGTPLDEAARDRLPTA
ncbi:N-acetylglucosamine kinase-like BadF-type ATPase [Friedmanniella endophytica]|uniref:N-acetylglucosamine kinase-like BadF-type ATPase n=1 Tax=Microlunatus kandeliicorticis TaxID=1759536 RepID=A0A7W3IVP0_9ACTN|nr:BadF/BadG/BcrA/BcrD ATPase family protein [Microlunatus kandeliicorticis]MBA8796059.1 N-acetylglucosamine kinase-like BadF-type ATPase [Microlunatus kandeliicorticis]